MKKLVLVGVVLAMAIASQAATFKWSCIAVNLKEYNSTTAYTGAVSIYVEGVSDLTGAIATLTANNGMIASNTSIFDVESSVMTAGSSYNFYLTYTTDGYTYTSTTATAPASGSASVSSTINFGNQASAGTWTSQAVPEPTSGLLLLFGMAGLALKRKHA